MPSNAKPGFGVEQFINLLVAVLQFYMANKVQIDAFITTAHTDKLTDLSADILSLSAVNPAGPNQVPVAEAEL